MRWVIGVVVLAPARSILGMDDLVHQALLGEEAAWWIAGDRLTGRRYIHEAAVGCRPVFPVRRVIGEHAVFLFAALKQCGALRDQGLEGAPQLGELQMGLDARADLIDVEGLGDVVGGADPKALELVLYLVDDGDEDHRDALAPGRGLDASADLVAVHLRHQDVEQDEIRGRLALDLLQRLGARARDLDAEFVLQRLKQGVQVLRAIIDQQQLRSLGDEAAGTGGLLRLRLLTEVRITAKGAQLELRAHPLPQQRGVHRLGHVVGGAELEAARLIGRFGQRCDEDDGDRCGAWVGLQL